jgi:hypothetical protein
MTLLDFEVAAGSVAGAEHRRTDRPNQDAWAWRITSTAVVAVVADGCGSGRHSEVGARLGANLWVEALSRRAPEHGDLSDPELYRRVRADVTEHLAAMAAAIGGDRARVVSDHFLFTLVGCVAAGDQLAVHAIGDGLFAIDGEVTELGPFPGNQPPYIGYDLLGMSGSPLSLCAVRRIEAIETVALCTDGAAGLATLPELCADPRTTRNRDALRRHLALANREVIEPDWDARRLRRSRGALADDTTVLVMRRAG